MIRLLACVLAPAMLAGRASACINDRELPGHEREFRSNYNGRPIAPVPLPAKPPAAPDYSPTFGGGAALLVAAAGLVVFRGRSKG